MIEELIRSPEAQIDSDDCEEVLEKCLAQIKAEGLGLSAVESLLLFMERHPLSDFGMPGALSTMRNSSAKRAMRIC